MNKFTNISNSNLTAYIDDWCKSERDRRLLKRRLIDGITIERLAEEFDLSTRQTQTIIQRNVQILLQNCI